ncbi:hypothetical protein DFJ77DRAFT_441972 [Powellomyces hirtus]|nr:hypothetical protein DFJ77DRAFT_441972 [Powellomyces hirtus]
MLVCSSIWSCLAILLAIALAINCVAGAAVVQTTLPMKKREARFARPTLLLTALPADDEAAAANPSQSAVSPRADNVAAAASIRITAREEVETTTTLPTTPDASGPAEDAGSTSSNPLDTDTKSTEALPTAHVGTTSPEPTPPNDDSGSSLPEPSLPTTAADGGHSSEWSGTTSTQPAPRKDDGGSSSAAEPPFVTPDIKFPWVPKPPKDIRPPIGDDATVGQNSDHGGSVVVTPPIIIIIPDGSSNPVPPSRPSPVTGDPVPTPTQPSPPTPSQPEPGPTETPAPPTTTPEPPTPGIPRPPADLKPETSASTAALEPTATPDAADIPDRTLYSAAAYLQAKPGSTGDDDDMAALVQPDSAAAASTASGAGGLQGPAILNPQAATPGRGSVSPKNAPGGSDKDGLPNAPPEKEETSHAMATKTITGLLISGCVSVAVVGGLLYRRKVNSVKAMALPTRKMSGISGNKGDSKPGDFNDEAVIQHSPLDDIFVAPGHFPTPPRTLDSSRTGTDRTFNSSLNGTTLNSETGPPPLIAAPSTLSTLSTLTTSTPTTTRTPAAAAAAGPSGVSFFSGLRLNNYLPNLLFLHGTHSGKPRKPVIPFILYSNSAPLASLALSPAPSNHPDKDIDGARDYVMPIGKPASFCSLSSDAGDDEDERSRVATPESRRSSVRSAASSWSLSSSVVSGASSEAGSLSRHLERSSTLGRAPALLYPTPKEASSPPAPAPPTLLRHGTTDISPAITTHHQRQRSWSTHPSSSSPSSSSSSLLSSDNNSPMVVVHPGSGDAASRRVSMASTATSGDVGSDSGDDARSDSAAADSLSRGPRWTARASRSSGRGEEILEGNVDVANALLTQEERG